MSCAEHLSSVLRDATSLYFRAHAAHWNVMGDDFVQFHELFGEIYEDVWGSLDPTAENIRKLDAFPPSSLKEIVAKAEITPGTGPVTDPQESLKELIALNDGVIKCLNEAFAAADKDNEQGIANFLADRIDQHQKWRWQMKSSLEAEPASDDVPAKSPQKRNPSPRPKANPVLKKIAPMTARPPKVS